MSLQQQPLLSPLNNSVSFDKDFEKDWYSGNWNENMFIFFYEYFHSFTHSEKKCIKCSVVVKIGWFGSLVSEIKIMVVKQSKKLVAGISSKKNKSLCCLVSRTHWVTMLCVFACISRISLPSETVYHAHMNINSSDQKVLFWLHKYLTSSTKCSNPQNSVRNCKRSNLICTAGSSRENIYYLFVYWLTDWLVYTLPSFFIHITFSLFILFIYFNLF